MTFIEGAKVEVYRAGVLIAWGFTDAKGRWSCVLPAGTYTVIISKAGYETIEQEVTFEKETEFKVNLPTAIPPPAPIGVREPLLKRPRIEKFLTQIIEVKKKESPLSTFRKFVTPPSLASPNLTLVAYRKPSLSLQTQLTYSTQITVVSQSPPELSPSLTLTTTVIAPATVVNPVEKGEIISDAEGKATISFTGVYPTKPFIAFTVEYTADDIMVNIDSWVKDEAGNYIGVNIRTRDDGGRAEANVKVLWALWE